MNKCSNFWSFSNSVFLFKDENIQLVFCPLDSSSFRRSLFMVLCGTLDVMLFIDARLGV